MAKSLPHKILDFLLDYWALALSLGFVVGVACFQYAYREQDGPVWLFLLIIAAGLAGGIGQLVNARSLSKQEDRLRVAKDRLRVLDEELPNHIRAVFDGYLTHLGAERLGTVCGDPDRLTIYLYDHDSECFVIVGRHARNYEFARCRTPSRKLTEGCLAKAWQSGVHYVPDLPDPDSNFEQYTTRQAETCGMSRQAVRRLTMKARTYFAARIDGAPGEPPAGVVVFESKEADRLGEDALREVFLGGANGTGPGQVVFIGQMLKLFAPYIPKQSDAERLEQRWQT